MINMKIAPKSALFTSFSNALVAVPRCDVQQAVFPLQAYEEYLM